MLPAVLNEHTSLSVHNSTDTSSRGNPESPLPTLDLPNSEKFSQERKEDGQHEVLLCTSDATLEIAQGAPMHRKPTIKSFDIFQDHHTLRKCTHII